MKLLTVKEVEVGDAGTLRLEFRLRSPISGCSRNFVLCSCLIVTKT